jgi:uncharacterized membrane protein YphA (DoxX/SURF4 family)
LAVLALVLLRLVVGWHFFTAGCEKFVYDPETRWIHVDFSAEGFLRQAKGPVVPLIQYVSPTGHDWEALLAVPRERTELTAEQAKIARDWESDYRRRISQAEKSGTTLPAEIPPQTAYSSWGREVLDDWKANRDNLLATSKLTDQQRRQIDEVYTLRSHQLADYLAGEESAIAEYHHQLWRLDAWKAEPEARDLPYLEDRIETKERETSAEPIEWVNQVRAFEIAYTNDFRNVLSTEQKADKQMTAAVDAALVDPKERTLGWISQGSAWLVLGVGALLLLGFFTRLASLAGGLFLIAVIATQPPWVPGAVDDFFWYQLIELAALGVLFATRAGRWLGLDFFTYALFNRTTE